MFNIVEKLMQPMTQQNWRSVLNHGLHMSMAELKKHVKSKEDKLQITIPCKNSLKAYKGEISWRESTVLLKTTYLDNTYC